MILQKYIGKRVKIVYQEEKTETIYGIITEFDDNYIEISLDNGNHQIIPKIKIYKIVPHNKGGNLANGNNR